MDANDANQTPDRERIYDRMLNMMNAYSSILQGYRSIFVTVQAIFFAVAIYVVPLPDRLAFILLAIVGINISIAWFFTCRRRGYDERFFHWQLLRMTKGEAL